MTSASYYTTYCFIVTHTSRIPLAVIKIAPNSPASPNLDLGDFIISANGKVSDTACRARMADLGSQNIYNVSYHEAVQSLASNSNQMNLVVCRLDPYSSRLSNAYSKLVLTTDYGVPVTKRVVPDPARAHEENLFPEDGYYSDE